MNLKSVLEEETKLFRLFFLALLVLAGLSYLRVLDPAKLFLPWKCPFKMLTGHPCPGCGMTDAIKALLAGRFRAAFWANPNVYPLLVFCLTSALFPERKKGQGLFLKAWLVFILGWWALRLKYGWPF